MTLLAGTPLRTGPWRAQRRQAILVGVTTLREPATARSEHPPLTRVPLYPGPLPRVRPDRDPWPGRILRRGGVALHVRDTPGPPGAPLAVYVHGLNGSATNFTDLAGLVGTRLPGMAVDLPGFGRTEPADGFDYSPTAYAAVLGDFLAGLDRGPVHLVANSMGGTAALLLAATRPELLGTLTLISPALPDLRVDPRRLSDPRYALTFLPVIGPRMCRELAAMAPSRRAEQLLRLCFADPSAVPAVRRQQATAELAERQTMAWAAAALNGSVAGLMRSWLVPRSRSLWTVAARVNHPALVVWGACDRVVSVRKAPRAAAALPRGRLLVLPRTGHVAQLERPTSVARALLGMIDAQARNEW